MEVNFRQPVFVLIILRVWRSVSTNLWRKTITRSPDDGRPQNHYLGHGIETGFHLSRRKIDVKGQKKAPVEGPLDSVDTLVGYSYTEVSGVSW